MTQERREWQAQTCPAGERPSLQVPARGWEPAGTIDGRWTPVSVAMGKDGAMVLWRRLLRRVRSATQNEDDEAMPRWAVRAARGHATANEVRIAVLMAIEAITGTQPDPRRAGTAARPILALWRTLEHPDLRLFVKDVELVAAACRDSGAPIFARDVRAEGWADGVDRSRHVATVCVQTRWADRLAAAQGWHAGGRQAEGRRDGGSARLGEPPPDERAPSLLDRA